MKNPEPASLPERVLLVDDNEHGLVARRVLLEEIGLNVTAVATPAEALAVFAPGRFDLLITDYKMEGIDGVELIRRIRATAPRLPVILISGFVEPLGLCEKNTGADAVIAKSAGEVTSLMRCVNRLLHRPIRKKPPSASSRPQVQRKVQTGNPG